jgi:hypothetical protein
MYVNSITGRAPIIMSLAALALVLFVVATGWERARTDEGAAAHLFQILIVLEVPVVALFLWSADWTRREKILRALGMQAVALILALGSVKLFGL